MKKRKAHKITVLTQPHHTDILPARETTHSHQNFNEKINGGS
jgi:hypothetical protein